MKHECVTSAPRSRFYASRRSRPGSCKRVAAAAAAAAVLCLAAMRAYATRRR